MAYRGLAILVLMPLVGLAEVIPEQAEFFEKRIRPLLIEHCYMCHSEKRARSGLRVDSREALLKGGSSKEPAIVPGHPDESVLIQALRGTHPSLEMPPQGKLTPAEIEAFTAWIKMGAPWPASQPVKEKTEGSLAGKDHWVFQARTNPTAPPVKDTNWPRNGIDHFILVKLEENNITPAARADKHTLLRRACFDLTGLPPTLEQIRRFQNDESPEALAKLIDRLLASPEYGRRWGRHWLDQARYADTSGDGTDMPVPEARKYRDYVIDSFNQDLPFDQFIVEQIAGDILAFENPGTRFEERIIATGYIALARRFKNSKNADPHLIVENTLDTIGKGMLGMTLSCARCHDHKFDPITTADYYRMYGFFKGVRYPHAGTEHGRTPEDLVPLVRDRAFIARHAQVTRERAEIHEALRNGNKDPIKRQLDELKQRKQALQTKIKQATNLGEDGATLQSSLEDLDRQIQAKEAELKQQRQDLEARLRQAEEELKVKLAWAVTDQPDKTGDARIQIGGEPGKRGQSVERGFPSIITAQAAAIPEGQSGRVQLARWIVAPDNPLTARVLANRIWQYHFAQGIVPTASAFGSQGKGPTHPALLDWLANQFINKGWSMKDMHRLIMNSATWQMASVVPAEHPAEQADPALYARYPSHRLDAESIRDAILAVSDTLDYAPLDEHPFPDEAQRRRITQHHPFIEDYDHKHRSIYLMRRRLGDHAFLALFDGPNPNQSAARREVSTVPQQALFMMNSDFVREHAAAFARRLLSLGETRQERIERAYLLAYGRAPQDQEVTRARNYLENYAKKLAGTQDSEHIALLAWTSLCRVMLSSNEFIYID